jgi:NAD(P)-dependent dehydrogenase (short-subunit alcohol dehydrogenase family)
MDRRFAGTAIVVTGAATGLGYATALRLAREGARLALVDLTFEALANAQEAIRAEAPDAETKLMPADVSDEDQVRGLVERAVRRFGRIDGLYNNAGIEGKQDAVEN